MAEKKISPKGGDAEIEIGFIKNIMIDYIIHDISATKICEKYNLSPASFFKIHERFKFKKRKFDYKKRVLDKAITSLSRKQNKILTTTVLVLQRQVERINLWQLNHPTEFVDSKRMQELLGVYSLLVKEYRLDNNKATDNQNININVSMPNIPIITENNKDIVETESVNIEEKEIPEVESIIEQPPQEIKIDIEEESDDLFEPIDDNE